MEIRTALGVLGAVSTHIRRTSSRVNHFASEISSSWSTSAWPASALARKASMSERGYGHGWLET